MKGNVKLSYDHHLPYHVEGYTRSSWSEWLDEMSINPQEKGETLLSGPLADQAGSAQLAQQNS
jgi:hypothetical protein